MCQHDVLLHREKHRGKYLHFRPIIRQPWSKPEGLEVRLPIRPAMKSEATNETIRYSLKRVPNYF